MGATVMREPSMNNSTHPSLLQANKVFMDRTMFRTSFLALGMWLGVVAYRL